MVHEWRPSSWRRPAAATRRYGTSRTRGVRVFRQRPPSWPVRSRIVSLRCRGSSGCQLGVPRHRRRRRQRTALGPSVVRCPRCCWSDSREPGASRSGAFPNGASGISERRRLVPKVVSRHCSKASHAPTWSWRRGMHHCGDVAGRGADPRSGRSRPSMGRSCLHRCDLQAKSVARRSARAGPARRSRRHVGGSGGDLGGRLTHRDPSPAATGTSTGSAGVETRARNT